METKPLWRRLSLRLRCVRPEQIAGKEEKTNRKKINQQWIEELAESARFRRTLVVVKRQFPWEQTLEPRERKRRDSHRGQVDKFSREAE